MCFLFIERANWATYFNKIGTSLENKQLTNYVNHSLIFSPTRALFLNKYKRKITRENKEKKNQEHRVSLKLLIEKKINIESTEEKNT